MQGQKPIKLYFFVTFLLILVVLLIGLKVNDYISQKYPYEPSSKNLTNHNEKPDDFSKAFGLLDLAISISLVLVLLFVIVKILMGKLRKV